MSRTGLLSLTLLFLCICLAVSAPVPERLSNLAERYDDYDNEFVARSLPMLSGREYNAVEELTQREYDLSGFDVRDLEEIGHGYTKRDDSDVHDLYRRKVNGAKIRQEFKKAGAAIKKFVKGTVAKVAKVYLKVAAAVATVASKVVKFIPGVGNGVSMALKGAAMGYNAASDRIHANIGKFQKFDNGLNHVISPFGASKGSKGAKIAKSLFL